MSAKIAARYRRDRPAIARALGFDPGRIVAVEAGWGDRHRGGQTVARVSFESGHLLAYKPRPVEPERLWAAVVTFVERRLRLGLMAPRAVSSGQHGWVEWMEADGTAIESAGALRRVGAIVALLDLLEVRDAHPDNFVITRGQAVLVDGETIGHPRLPGFEPTPSIILTGALPWPPGRGNRTLLAGVARRPGQAAFLVEGYRAVHRLKGHSGAMLLRVLRKFRDCRIRVVLRPSRVYATALRRGRTELPPPPGVTALRATHILTAERRALHRGDIPLFEADLAGTDLRDETRIIVPEFFQQSGWQAIVDRVNRPGGREVREGLTLLRSCLQLGRVTGGRR